MTGRRVDVLLPVMPHDLVHGSFAVDLARARLTCMARLVLVVPDRAVAYVESLGLADEVLSEDALHPVLARTPPGWMKQQMIKLCAARAAHTDVVLVLDADVLVLRDVTEADLFVGDRAKFFVEDRGGSVHPDWIAASAAFVGVDPAGTPSYWPTPNLLDLEVLARLHGHLARRHGTDAVEAMLRHHGRFTEWATYGLFAASDPVGRDRHAFVEERHAAGVWNPAEAAAWTYGPDSPPFLVAHGWAPIAFAPWRALVERETGVAAPARAGAERVRFVPAGAPGVCIRGDERVDVRLPHDRIVWPHDVLAVEARVLRLRLRVDRWGDDLGGGVLEVAHDAILRA